MWIPDKAIWFSFLFKRCVFVSYVYGEDLEENDNLVSVSTPAPRKWSLNIIKKKVLLREMADCKFGTENVHKVPGNVSRSIQCIYSRETENNNISVKSGFCLHHLIIILPTNIYFYVCINARTFCIHFCNNLKTLALKDRCGRRNLPRKVYSSGIEAS